MSELFDWDQANRSHIAEHGVSPEEAEQVVLNEPLDLTLQQRDGEERTVQVGETDGGRILVVVTTWRRRKIRVVTAFPAKQRLRNFYERYKREHDNGGEDGDSKVPQ
jgi:hypothetical protein